MRYNYFTAHIMPEMRCDAMRCDAMRPAMRPGRQRSLEPRSSMASVSSVRFNGYGKRVIQAYE